VKDMIGFGICDKPIGIFSDHCSLTFCLAEAFPSGFGIHRVGNNFVKWRYDNYRTAKVR